MKADHMSDAEVDAIAFTPGGELVQVRGAPPVVEDFFSRQRWRVLRYYLDVLTVYDEGGDSDDFGFRTENSHVDPDEERVEGAVIYVPWDEQVQMSIRAFHRLMKRFYGTVVEAAGQAREQAWWPDFEGKVRSLVP